MNDGRDADRPSDIPSVGWKEIAFRVKDNLGSHHVSLIAAGVAFYALLALFPAMTALMAMAGLILQPSEITTQIQQIASLMPEAAADIVIQQAVSIAGSRDSGLGLAFAIGLLLSLYSASKGMGSLMEGLNVAYEEEEDRGFVMLKLVTLMLTFLLMIGLVGGLAGALAVPILLDMVPMPGWLSTVLAWSRWLILAALTVAGLAALYRWGPSREDAQWKWLSPGAVAACIIWIVASIGFSVYVGNFGSYNETFGSMAGVIVLLLWLWLSAFIVLIGAELNAEMEAQTGKDTTTGARQPMGARKAEKANTVEA